MSIHLILGGARSGKSSHAEQKARLKVATLSDGRLHYVATAVAFDDEMTQRIDHHKRQRGDLWTEHEEAIDLATTLSQFTAHDVVLVDCLTLWLNNVIYNHGKTARAAQIAQALTQLVSTLNESPATLILVSNEVGMGVVPMGEISRLFVDHAGWMNQAIAAMADSVVLVAAGLPLTLKGTP